MNEILNMFTTPEQVKEKATKEFLLEVAHEQYKKNGEYDCLIYSIYYNFDSESEMREFAKNFDISIDEKGIGVSLYLYRTEDFIKEHFSNKLVSSEHFDCICP